MSFGEAIQTVFRKYAEFEGRARRPEYWWWVLFTTLVAAALNALVIPIGRGGPTFGSMLSSVWAIGILLPSLAVLVRRLRDAGFGWGHVFWVFLPIIGTIVLIVMAAQPSRDRPRRDRTPITEAELDALPVVPVSPLAGAGMPVAPTPNVEPGGTMDSMPDPETPQPPFPPDAPSVEPTTPPDPVEPPPPGSTR